MSRNRVAVICVRPPLPLMLCEKTDELDTSKASNPLSITGPLPLSAGGAAVADLQVPPPAIVVLPL